MTIKEKKSCSEIKQACDRFNDEFVGPENIKIAISSSISRMRSNSSTFVLWLLKYTLNNKKYEFTFDDFFQWVVQEANSHNLSIIEYPKNDQNYKTGNNLWRPGTDSGILRVSAGRYYINCVVDQSSTLNLVETVWNLKISGKLGKNKAAVTEQKIRDIRTTGNDGGIDYWTTDNIPGDVKAMFLGTDELTNLVDRLFAKNETISGCEITTYKLKEGADNQVLLAWLSARNYQMFLTVTPTGECDDPQLQFRFRFFRY